MEADRHSQAGDRNQRHEKARLRNPISTGVHDVEKPGETDPTEQSKGRSAQRDNGQASQSPPAMMVRGVISQILDPGKDSRLPDPGDFSCQRVWKNASDIDGFYDVRGNGDQCDRGQEDRQLLPTAGALGKQGMGSEQKREEDSLRPEEGGEGAQDASRRSIAAGRPGARFVPRPG